MMNDVELGFVIGICNENRVKRYAQYIYIYI